MSPQSLCHCVSCCCASCFCCSSPWLHILYGRYFTSEKGTAQHGAGMQCHRIPVRVSLVNTDPVLLARPHSIPLLCHFHRSTADSQRRFQATRKRPRLQHDGACVSADVEAASAFCYSVRAADRSGLSILFEAVAPHPAAAPDRLGSQSARLWYFTADLRTRLTATQPDN